MYMDTDAYRLAEKLVWALVQWFALSFTFSQYRSYCSFITRWSITHPAQEVIKPSGANFFPLSLSTHNLKWSGHTLTAILTPRNISCFVFKSDKFIFFYLLPISFRHPQSFTLSRSIFHVHHFSEIPCACGLLSIRFAWNYQERWVVFSPFHFFITAPVRTGRVPAHAFC